MLEEVNSYYRKVPKRVEQFAMRSLIKQVEPFVRSGDFKHLSDLFLDKLNVTGRYMAASRPDFRKNRERLQHQPGIVISNHPGYIDPLLLLSQIERRDILIMLHNNIYKSAKDQLGGVANKYFISNLRESLPQAQEHIADGGLFIFFPTGLQGPIFKNGFREIVDTIASDTMVYSFHLDKDDVDKTEKEKLSLGAGLAYTFLPTQIPSMRQMGEKFIIDVDERVSSADEWKRVIADNGDAKRRNVSAALQMHYEKQFAA
ncbi:hypothetical protein A3C18_01665 [Candidatus Kaiserbacteria bacterium RIFCSPHIGHO2_02_FULL_54_11b]|uniref:Phospholipid/glycerol acyltransferase domain-containing protein n=2 Tax=Candidatus Kaiseribacteriota TaxID=1752734 RepID=A0A1F6CR45_9BACT|nr:MAG: hypothetical protein A2704_04825 [Candidatus Kaiserbacteria bacterium RIFCSPHIGHO2_01_FULL_54_36b]OGG63904.1 MAG: hypothetical protein A3C18_01665 [Candidatus Kaiserbacteria bacterium RIFCSPHIGHO2_02_FULL_54_11b]